MCETYDQLWSLKRSENVYFLQIADFTMPVP